MKVTERLALLEEIEFILHSDPTIAGLITASHKLEELIIVEKEAEALRDQRKEYGVANAPVSSAK